MDLFRYPQAKHQRVFRPRVFKHYGSYKRWLQQEFRRVCVYCREPDSYSTNLNFGVDHYRPQSRFPTLVCSYENLFYCCGNCNSRKSQDWPADEANGPYVVNPCDHLMASHLRFNAELGTMEARTPWGEHTQKLLQLDDPATVAFRKSCLLNATLCEREIATLNKRLLALRKKLAKHQISQSDHDAAVAEFQADLAATTELLNAVTGATPLPALPRRRMGVPVHP